MRKAILFVTALATGVALAEAAPPPTAKAPAARSSPAERVQAMKDVALAKRPAPKLVSGFHAGMVAVTAVAKPDLINHIPRIDYHDFSLLPATGWATYFSVLNNSTKPAASSVLRLECQLNVTVPYPDETSRAADEKLVCGSIGKSTIFPVQYLPAGQPSPEFMVRVFTGPCSAPPDPGGRGWGYPYVTATVDWTNKVDEGTDGEKNNWMWIRFCWDQ